MTSKEFKSNHIFSIISMGLQLGLAFSVFIILLRILSPDHLGQWIIFSAIYSFAELAKSGLIQNGYLHFSKSKDFLKTPLYATGLVLSISSGFGFGLFVYLISFPLSIILKVPELSHLALYYPCFSILMSVQRFFEIHWISKNDYKRLSISKALYGGLFIVGIILAYFSGNLHLTMIPLLQIIAIALTIGISTTFLSCHFSFKSYKISYLRKMIKYGRFVLGTNVGSMFLNKIDVLFISVFINPTAVALYNTASRLINIIEIPLTSISQVSFPRISEAYQNKSLKRTSFIFEEGLALAFALLIPLCIGLLVFADQILLIIAGADYVSSAYVLRILCFTVIIKAIGRFSGISLDAIGLPNWNFYILIFSIVLNLGLNYIFIQTFGITGVAYATLMSIAVSSLFALYTLKRVLPVQLIKVFQYIKPIYQQILNKRYESTIR